MEDSLGQMVAEKTEQIKLERHILDREQVMREQAETKVDELMA